MTEGASQNKSACSLVSISHNSIMTMPITTLGSQNATERQWQVIIIIHIPSQCVNYDANSIDNYAQETDQNYQLAEDRESASDQMPSDHPSCSDY